MAKSTALTAGQIALRLDDGSTQIVNSIAEAQALAAQSGVQKRIAHRDETRAKAQSVERATVEAHMAEFFATKKAENELPTLDQINEARAYASLLGQKASRSVYLDNGYTLCVRDNCVGGLQKNLATPGFHVCRPCFLRDKAAREAAQQ